MLDLFSMRFLRDEVSNILLLTHLRGGGKSGQGLGNEELGIGLQAGESTDIRQRLVLFVIVIVIIVIVIVIVINNGNYPVMEHVRSRIAYRHCCKQARAV